MTTDKYCNAIMKEEEFLHNSVFFAFITTAVDRMKNGIKNRYKWFVTKHLIKHDPLFFVKTKTIYFTIATKKDLL